VIVAVGGRTASLVVVSVYVSWFVMARILEVRRGRLAVNTPKVRRKAAELLIRRFAAHCCNVVFVRVTQ
jgi:hypothetical protein